MELEDYPFCCGAMILCRLGYSMSAFYPSDELEKAPEIHQRAPQPGKTEFIKKLKHYKKVFYLKGMLLIMVDAIQKPIIGPWLEQEGATVVATANNGGDVDNPHPIYLYVIVLNELKED